MNHAALILAIGLASGWAEGTSKAGQFRVSYQPHSEPRHVAIQKHFQQSEIIEKVISKFNSQIAMPSDVVISFAKCGQSNAFYSPNEKRITICFEIIDRFAAEFRPGRQELVQKKAKSFGTLLNESVRQAQINSSLGAAATQAETKESWEKVGNAVVFILLHEIGHALVDQLDLPITGREEDAVDQLATFQILKGDSSSVEATIAGAEALLVISPGSLESLIPGVAADEHSLGPQRFYNVLCWAYGSDSERWDYLVSRGALPKNRAKRCYWEVARVSRSWETLLAQHRRTKP